MTQPKRPPISLELIEIASPCTASWDAMHGDDRVRFCDECKLHVYNLSAMSRVEASELVASREGRLCVQMYRRADGTVITDDCGRIRKAARRAVMATSRLANVALCAMASVMPIAMLQWVTPIQRWLSVQETRGEIASQIAGGIRAPATQPTMLMGDVAAPTTAPTSAPTTQPLRGKPSIRTSDR